MNLSSMPTPCRVVDKEILEKNLYRMARAASREGKEWWPMVKTHKSLAIAKMQQKAGATGFTASTLWECDALLKQQLGPVLLAYPLCCETMIAWADRLRRFGRLLLSADMPEHLDLLEGYAEQYGAPPWEVVLTVDCGSHHLGVSPRQCLELARRVGRLPRLRLGGVATYPGQSYDAAFGPHLAAAQEEVTLKETRELLQSEGYEPPLVFGGSTPTWRQSAKNASVTVLRGGNGVFFDRTQMALGAAEWKDCAYTILTRVIGIYGDHAVVDAGAKLFCRDGVQGKTIPFGTVAGHPDLFCAALSEENAALTGAVDTLHVGQLLTVIPNHACTSACSGRQYVLTHHNRVIDILPVDLQNMDGTVSE